PRAPFFDVSHCLRGAEKGERLSDAIHPVAALDRIGYILERTREPMFRVKAFRNAADAIRGLSDDELRELAVSGRLRDLPGSAERLREQRKVVDALNEKLAPFRILTGIEVDILEDGNLDQEPDLLAHLDVVVASVHSKLRMDGEQMTRRMIGALANPHMDILGHCTGRIVVGRGRPESSFDAELVFAAAEKYDKAVEINSRPERLDPPRRLLRLAIEMGCRVAIDTDAHAPGQLEWQVLGCDRAAE